MGNPFDIFKTHETESAIAQKEGEEAKFYPHGTDGKPLDEFKAAWWQWTRGFGFADPRDPKFIAGYPVKGHNGIWYQFNDAGELILWTGGDPEKYIKDHPRPDPFKPTLEQITRLYQAAFPE